MDPVEAIANDGSWLTYHSREWRFSCSEVEYLFRGEFLFCGSQRTTIHAVALCCNLFCPRQGNGIDAAVSGDHAMFYKL